MPLTKIQSRGTDNVGQGSSNIIINGAMTVSQRGDSTGITSGGYYACDRFKSDLSGVGTWSIAQSTTAPTNKGFQNSVKLDCTTANGSLASGAYFIYQTRIEGQNLQSLAFGTSEAKPLVLSFYVKSNKTGTYHIGLYNTDNARMNGRTYTIDSANTWELKTISFDADTSQGFTNDNNSSLLIEWWLAGGTDYTSGSTPTAWTSADNTIRAGGLAVNLADSTDNEWLMTGVQLEVGSQASDFQHEDIGTTRRKCMRYFHSINGAGHSDPTDSAYGRYISFGQDNNGLRWFHHFPEEMRSAPTMTANNISSSTIQHFNYNTQTGISMTGTGLNEGGKRTGQIFFTFSSGAGVGSIVSWRWNNNPDASFDFDSEL
jgi:hypothetical protein